MPDPGDDSALSQQETEDAELVRALCRIEAGLSEWSMHFVESIHRQLAAKRDQGEAAVLTERQRAKALEIATEMDV